MYQESSSELFARRNTNDDLAICYDEAVGVGVVAGTRFVGYISHGCDPNCRLDMQRQELVALRDIAPDELLSIDYAETEDRLFINFSCSCGAEKCRDWIVGRIEAGEPPENDINNADHRH